MYKNEPGIVTHRMKTNVPDTLQHSINSIAPAIHVTPATCATLGINFTLCSECSCALRPISVYTLLGDISQSESTRNTPS
jgi:hypothetical protein